MIKPQPLSPAGFTSQKILVQRHNIFMAMTWWVNIAWIAYARMTRLRHFPVTRRISDTSSGKNYGAAEDNTVKVKELSSANGSSKQ